MTSRPYDQACESLGFNEEPVFEKLKEVVSADQLYKYGLEALKEFELLAWEAVKSGRSLGGHVITAAVAEDAIWEFIEYVEEQ